LCFLRKESIYIVILTSIPVFSKISGGDLDGDIYYVTWDARLIPEKPYKSMDYFN